jgi:hypothetical protein
MIDFAMSNIVAISIIDLDHLIDFVNLSLSRNKSNDLDHYFKCTRARGHPTSKYPGRSPDRFCQSLSSAALSAIAAAELESLSSASVAGSTLAGVPALSSPGSPDPFMRIGSREKQPITNAATAKPTRIRVPPRQGLLRAKTPEWALIEGRLAR